MTISQEKVIHELKTIIDPITKLNIVDAQLISKIIIDHENNIKFSLEIEKSSFERRSLLSLECQKILTAIPGVKKVIVGVTNTPNIAKKVIVVASGKGGVGKSTVALNIAVGLGQMGYKTALVDTDIYGPSIPHMLGVTDKPDIKDGKTIIPVKKYGINSMSIGYFIPPTSAVIWRGPMLTKSINQMVLGTKWPDLDYMIIDTPPGTGDIHISLKKICHISSVILVSTPQELAITEAIKALDMFNKLKIPVQGIIENMSYLANTQKQFVFGKNGAQELSKQYSIQFLGEVPLEPTICTQSDAGIPAILSAQVKPFFLTILDNIV